MHRISFVLRLRKLAHLLLPYRKHILLHFQGPKYLRFCKYSLHHLAQVKSTFSHVLLGRSPDQPPRARCVLRERLAHSVWSRKQQQAIAMWTTPPRRWTISAIAGTCHTDPCPLRRNEDAYVTPCIREYVGDRLLHPRESDAFCQRQRCQS